MDGGYGRQALTRSGMLTTGSPAGPIEGPAFVARLGLGVEHGYAAGVMRYLSAQPEWTLMIAGIEERTLADDSPDLIWPDGLIVGVLDEASALAVRRSGRRVVNLVNSPLARGVPTVCADNVMAGRLAFEHLFERGLRQFAYLPWRMGVDDVLREQGFLEAAAEHGMSGSTTVVDCVLSRRQWLADMHDQADIFADVLKPPTGLLCFSDWLAGLAMSSLRLAGLSVPDDVAIMGMGDEEMICPLMRPALSSVDMNHGGVGFEAARLLDTMTRGGPAPQEPVIVAPLGVIERGSTQLMACEDRDVAAAVSLIEKEPAAGRRPGVEWVCGKVLTPRRTLDAKFTRYLQHTVADVIVKTQLRMTLRHLERSEGKLQEVATHCGFKNITQLARFVHRHTGRTPSDYRRWARTGG